MIEFIFAGENLPFAVSIILMLLMALFEAVGLLLGAGLSQVMDSLLPDLDLELNMDLDADAPGFQAPSIFHALLGWLRIGQIPAFALLVAFLTIYGLTGYGFQLVISKFFGAMLPAVIAGIVVFFLSLPLIRICGGALAKVIPKDETYAVSEDTFIGRAAIITLGKAVVGRPASARLQDHYGTTHYMMVEPDQEDEEFVQGDQVLLVSRRGSLFKAIRNTKEVLLDEEINK
ncbi:MAG: YqiJ family protein [Desulfobulbaceae bacterium]|nr:YqiJ family protein [Desulfobulbaceae bacterium]